VLDNLKLAVAFLTRIRVGITHDTADKRLARCVSAFPAVGLLIGVCAATADMVARYLFSSLGALGASFLGAFTALSVCCVLTGALHIDGLADTLDGLLGGRDLHHTLEIMKDPRVGAAGVIGIVLDIGARLLLLGFLPETHRFAVIMIAPVVGRLCQVFGVVCWPYARKSGAGKPFAQYAGYRELGWAAGISLCITLVTFRLAHAPPLLLLGAMSGCLVAAALFASAVARRLAGLTGDVYGAMNEIAEISFIALFAVLL